MTIKTRLEALVTEMVERGILFQDAVEEFEKHFIFSVLQRTNGNVSKAADELHIHRNTLSKRLDKYYENGHPAGARPRLLKSNRASRKVKPLTRKRR